MSKVDSPAQAEPANGDASDEMQSIKAYRAIRSAIAELSLRPGQPLSESMLAERFGFGRMPVREAVNRLRHDGLLVAIPRKGIFVNPLQIDDVREIYEMLEALDGMVLKLVATSITDEQVRELEGIAEAEERALRAGEQEEWIRCNKEFHQQLVALANNGRIANTMDLLEEQISRATRLSYSLRPKPFQSIEEHRAIVQALRERDPEKARLTGLRHRERVRTEILQALARVDGILGAY